LGGAVGTVSHSQQHLNLADSKAGDLLDAPEERRRTGRDQSKVIEKIENVTEPPARVGINRYGRSWVRSRF
jgi:hypothetical protein